jgi:hypothetical protein
LLEKRDLAAIPATNRIADIDLTVVTIPPAKNQRGSCASDLD